MKNKKDTQSIKDTESMKNKQSILNILFGLITFLTIIAKSYPVGSNGRMILTIVSIIAAVPFLFILVKNKMYNNRLNMFVGILVVFQIINIFYYTYVLKS
ncbi:hypothetical protein KQI86_14960 [Clostridium sp. MSJ-11]|uniref:Uncharacterized protein n=1 Tax=Clostridium mobile TaxID=2841512 RepID=A0ABS6EK79_9CLOT|nr:hypothetical protein [Clostridium mobile]MBU5485618.1 hypothetical protein [Clostridium mobile]